MCIIKNNVIVSMHTKLCFSASIVDPPDQDDNEVEISLHLNSAHMFISRKLDKYFIKNVKSFCIVSYILLGESGYFKGILWRNFYKNISKMKTKL
ncbi:unnamed protein product [Heterobilharzia americana]|nr:unnamed protein product [Heterobilharzia americana]